MKRYSLRMFAIAPNPPTGAIVDRWEPSVVEAADGEWLRYADFISSSAEVGSTLVFCKNCAHVCKPTGAMYEPHQDSICLANKLVSFVTGDSFSIPCKEINMDGKCIYFKRR